MRKRWQPRRIAAIALTLCLQFADEPQADTLVLDDVETPALAEGGFQLCQVHTEWSFRQPHAAPFRLRVFADAGGVPNVTASDVHFGGALCVEDFESRPTNRVVLTPEGACRSLALEPATRYWLSVSLVCPLARCGMEATQFGSGTRVGKEAYGKPAALAKAPLFTHSMAVWNPSGAAGFGGLLVPTTRVDSLAVNLRFRVQLRVAKASE